MRDWLIEKTIKNLGPLASAEQKGLGVVDRVIQKTSRSVDRRVKNVFDITHRLSSSKGIGISLFTEIDRKEKFERLRSDIKLLNTDPMALMERLNNKTEALDSVAPEMAQSVREGMMRANAFLATKIPGPQGPESPFSEPYEPSDTELAQFARYHDIVDRPLDALDQVATGTLTKEAVETLQAVYPSLYSDMSQKLLEQANTFVSKKRKMPFRTKQMISFFLGEPLELALSPQAIMANQSAFMAQAQEENQVNPTVGGLKELTKADRTGLDRNEEA